jgi:hypothetical protein
MFLLIVVLTGLLADSKSQSIVACCNDTICPDDSAQLSYSLDGILGNNISIFDDTYSDAFNYAFPSVMICQNMKSSIAWVSRFNPELLAITTKHFGPATSQSLPAIQVFFILL